MLKYHLKYISKMVSFDDCKNQEGKETMTHEMEDVTECLKDLIEEGKIRITRNNDGTIREIQVNPK